LGGGAAGLWAAAVCAGRGRRTLLLEKNARPGVKILASGGGRCNLTTTLSGPAVAEAFGREGGRFLATALRTLTPTGVREEFARLGVPTHAEALEKIWPDSGKSRDVLEALLRRARAAGAEVRTAVAATGVERKDGGLLVRTREGDVACGSVVVAVGGMSYPRTGTTGDGYAWMESLGHTVVRCVPALVPLVVQAPWVRELRGIDVPDARVSVVSEGRALAERRRPLLFTHTGLSGPGPMDVSRWFERAPPWRKPLLALDFLPGRPEEDVRAALAAAAEARPSDPVARSVPGPLPTRLVEALCAVARVPPGKRAAEVSKADRHALVQATKRCVLPVAGTRGFDYAEVTAGGVALEEVDPGTMRSRIVPGLHLIGEILDVDGPIGGFNFQPAFSTAELAGRSA
jgi:predicted Rossmann fold flavoprotein